MNLLQESEVYAGIVNHIKIHAVSNNSIRKIESNSLKLIRVTPSIPSFNYCRRVYFKVVTVQCTACDFLAVVVKQCRA